MKAIGVSDWRRALGTPPRIGIISSGRDRVVAEEIYRPLRPLAQFTSTTRRLLVGGPLAPLSVGPRVPTPDIVRHRLVAPFLENASGLALMSGSSGRSLLGVARDGRFDAVLKIGLASDAGLEREAQWLAAPPAGIRTPELRRAVVGEGVRVLVIGAIRGFHRAPVIALADVVDVCVRLQSLSPPVVHGDLAPWNLVVSPGSSSVSADAAPVLIDWERARRAVEPVSDLTQFLVQRRAQLQRRTDPVVIIDELVRPDGPGWTCLTRLGRDPATVRSLLAVTLRSGVIDSTEFEPARRLWLRLAEWVEEE